MIRDEFLSELFTSVCKLLQIKKIQTTAFHPESNGSLESGHKVLVEYLRHYIAEDQRDLDEWVAYITYVYNVRHIWRLGTLHVNCCLDTGHVYRPRYRRNLPPGITTTTT